MVQFLYVIFLIVIPICSFGKKVLHKPCKTEDNCEENQICQNKRQSLASRWVISAEISVVPRKKVQWWQFLFGQSNLYVVK